MQNKDIETLIKMLARLPGFGQKSAKRAILYMLQHKETFMEPLISHLDHTKNNIVECGSCGNLDTRSPCSICSDTSRDETLLCVVENVAELWAMERTQAFKGTYHVLGGTLSAIDGITPQDLTISALLEKCAQHPIKEVIIALKATVDGQTTAHYLADHLNAYDLEVTRLAHGMPIGGELDFMDDGTITTALKSRRQL